MRNYLMSKIPTNIFHLQPQPKLCTKIRQARHQRTIANCQHTISYKQTVSPSFFYIFVHHIKEANSIYEETPLLYNIFLVALYY